ncbi:tetratricopeptide repeat protein [Nocardiopsis sp. ARC36]
MSASYQGNHNDFRDSAFNGPFVNEQHHHYPPRHDVDWPVRVGAIPEVAAHYQHRAITDRLDQDLHSFGTVILRQVLSGTGGVGKTQLAAHHARTLREITDPDQRIDVLVWTNAASRSSITSAYAHAAQQLFNTIPEDVEDAARFFLTWLTDPNKHRHRRWLVVWDDLADPRQVEDLWPPHDQPCGRVLVTTRRCDNSLTVQGRHLIDVDIYTPEEACAFLTRALDTAGIAHTEADLDALASALGHLPLALGQVVPYMAELGMDCRDYLDVFHDRISTLHEVFPDWDTDTPLAATWDLSLTQADTFHPQGLARPLMGLIALLDGAGIPQSVLNAEPAREYLAAHAPQTATGNTEAGTPAVSVHQVRTALAGLNRLNLITRTAPKPDTGVDGRVVRVHQLVQRATREHIASRPCRHSVHALALSLAKSWPENERNTSLVQSLCNNTNTLHGQHAIEGQKSSEDWIWELGGYGVLFLSGNSMGEIGQVNEAVCHWRNIVRAANQYLGSDHLSTLSARSRLAHWRGKAGDTAGSVSAHAEILTDQLRTLGPDHPNTLVTRSNLALWQGISGDTTGAANVYAEILTDQLRIFGPDHPNTLTTRANLALCQSNAGDLARAISAYEELLTDRLRILGPDHPDTLNTRHNLALCQSDAGNTTEAISDFEGLLADSLRILGPDHPSTLTTRSNIAHCKGKLGNTTEAISDFGNLLADSLRILGPDHPNTLITRNNLASWHGESGDAATASQAFQDLLKDQLRIHGPEHPQTLTTRANLISWQGHCGKLHETVKAFKDLLIDQTRVLGHDHLDTLSTRHNLASWQGHSGDTEGAITGFKNLLTDRLRLLGPDHPDTLITQANIAAYAYDSGDIVTAIKTQATLLRNQRRALGPDHPSTQTSVQVLQRWRHELSEEVTWPGDL